MKAKIKYGIVSIALAACIAGFADASNDDSEKIKSGYEYASQEIRDIQDDEFSNPAFFLLDDAEAQWSTVDGTEGKSCASCHDDPATSMKGVGVTYPKYDEVSKKPITLSQKINRERKERMGAKKWKWESPKLLGVAAFIMSQSAGMTFKLNIEGPMEAFYNKGKELYFSRNGQLGMACKHCHIDYPDTMIRGNRLSNGLANGFPTYRIGAQKLVSLHNRFRGCEKRLRAQPYKTQSDEYTNMELYLKWRGRNIPVEMPSVRL